MPNLKQLLLLDAVSCAGMGVLLIAGASMIEIWMAIPAGLSITAGLLLLPVAAFMALTGARLSNNAAAVWTVILGNAGWVAASFFIVAAGLVQPNALGVVFILAQGAFVTVLALMEYAAVRAERTRLA